MNSVLTALEQRELKMSASHFGITVIRITEKGEFGIGIHKFLFFFLNHVAAKSKVELIAILLYALY